jgi:hypothetical protein
VARRSGRGPRSIVAKADGQVYRLGADPEDCAILGWRNGVRASLAGFFRQIRANRGSAHSAENDRTGRRRWFREEEPVLRCVTVLADGPAWCDRVSIVASVASHVRTTKSDRNRTCPLPSMDTRYNYAMHDAHEIPKELGACQSLLVELQRQLRELLAHRDESDKTSEELCSAVESLRQERVELKLTIEQLLHRLYGHRSEKLKEGLGQQHLDFGEGSEAAASVADTANEIETVVVLRRNKQRMDASRRLAN